MTHDMFLPKTLIVLINYMVAMFLKFLLKEIVNQLSLRSIGVSRRSSDEMVIKTNYYVKNALVLTEVWISTPKRPGDGAYTEKGNIFMCKD